MRLQVVQTAMHVVPSGHGECKLETGEMQHVVDQSAGARELIICNCTSLTDSVLITENVK
jgi:hypothetical protein